MATKVPKTRAGGTMSESAFKSFIKSGLRTKSRRWPPIFQCLNESKVGKMTNKLTGRLAMHHKCSACEEPFPAKNVVVDHIYSVVPLTGFTTWDDVIKRLFIEKEGLQVMCKGCHHWKTQAERQIGRECQKDDQMLTEMLDGGDPYILSLVQERAKLLAEENE